LSTAGDALTFDLLDLVPKFKANSFTHTFWWNMQQLTSTFQKFVTKRRVWAFLLRIMKDTTPTFYSTQQQYV